MAEDSLFWDGTATGHAASTDIWSAPYSSAEMSDLLSTLLGSDAARGYVVPGFGNDLKVQANSPVALNVIVKSGRVMVRGRLYGNTADNVLTIGTADATNPRLDRIVARISFASQTITLAVLAGTAAATPSLPSLTQNATTYEIGLAYVWVAATATTIANTEIHDERIFAANFESLLSAILQPNLLTNSEFMAFSRLDSNGLTESDSPDGMWERVGTVTTWANQTKPSQMSRGRAIRVTAGAATSGLAQTVRVKASTVYSIKGLIQVTAGDVGQIGITTNSGAPATITRNIRRTGAWIEVTAYYTTESDASTLTLSLLGLNNTDIVDFGQWLIVEGYNPGTFRQIHETIIFKFPLSDPDFDADNFTAGVVATTIDFDSDYQGVILPGTQSVLLHTEMTINTTSTTVIELGIGDWYSGGVGFSVLRANTNLNGIIKYADGFVPLNSGNQIELYRNVPGGTTLTLGIYVIGIIT